MTHLLLGLLLNTATVIATISIHYEVLSRLYRGLPKLPLSARSRIIAGVAGALLAHTLEVFIFALAFRGNNRRLCLFFVFRLYHGGLWRYQSGRANPLASGH